MDEGESENLNKKDFAWDYTIINPDEKYFKCRFCNQQCSGSINRLKHHLAGTHKGMKPCPKVPSDVAERCKNALKKAQDMKAKRNAALEEIRAAAIRGYNSCGDSGSSSNNTLSLKPRGPIDNFVNAQARQATLNSKWKKEERKSVCQLIGRFFFSSGIPFNVANDPYYLPMYDGVASYGPGFIPPSMHELRTWVLKDEVSNINKMLEEHKKSWKQYGCSIMSDSWTDGKSRCFINFLVNSPAGTFFLRSINASDSIKSGEMLAFHLNKIIDEVGEDNVVQMITDNGSNFVNAGKRIMDTRLHTYWTPCAAHCIDLMLEDIGKLKIHQSTLTKAKQVVKYIYGHTWVLDLMRSFTKNHELLRPAITRFATAYLTLQSIQKQKQALRSMFTSEAWNNSTWAKKHDGVKTRAIVLFDQNFWPHISYCVKSVTPLVSVLREVDSEENPCMGYMYYLLNKAKEKIAFNCGNNEKKYGPIWKRIDDRWKNQLHRSLHAAGYYLKPQLRFEENFSTQLEIKEDLLKCMERMLNYQDRLKVDIQLDSYDHLRGDFGSQVAMDSRKMRTPADWWTRFGGRTPELTKFAIRVLSLTCSSSGCERNWSTFESIHTKKRNRLEHHRLNALVYVRYNTSLRERSIKRKMQSIDPILVDEIDSDDDWITEKEDPVLPEEPSWLDEENLFDVDVIKMVPVTPYEDDLTHETMVNISSVKDTERSSKKQRVAETSGLQGGQSLQVQTDEGLQDVEIVDEVRCATTNTKNMTDDELLFDSD